jgi:hypothetical protein
MYGRTLVRTTQVWCPSTHLVKTVFLVFHSVFLTLVLFFEGGKKWGWTGEGVVRKGSFTSRVVCVVNSPHNGTHEVLCGIPGHDHFWSPLTVVHTIFEVRLVHRRYIGWEKTTMISTYLQPMNLLYVHRFLSSLT